MTCIRLNHPGLPPALRVVLPLAGALPRYWPTVWLTLRSGSLADNRFADMAAAIDRLYRTVAARALPAAVLLGTATVSALG